jgi:hypothetical protein
LVLSRSLSLSPDSLTLFARKVSIFAGKFLTELSLTSHRKKVSIFAEKALYFRRKRSLFWPEKFSIFAGKALPFSQKHSTLAGKALPFRRKHSPLAWKASSLSLDLPHLAEGTFNCFVLFKFYENMLLLKASRLIVGPLFCIYDMILFSPLL